jgi:hypothetical protein
MSNQRVSIIERVKRNGKWVWGEKWELPVKFTVKQGSRQGKFYVLWYCGANKVLTPVPKRNATMMKICFTSMRQKLTANGTCRSAVS